MIKFDRLDSAGLAEVLKSSEVRGLIDGLAEQAASNVRSAHPEADVVVDKYTTDRAAASITIRDARGREWQVRDGVLTRAATSVGLEVKGSAE